jgi:DNA-directed RNA polymerase beta' subunit
MCHRARVFGKENTIQLHYANCSTYNADFDGDEMNLHLPQNEMARAEAKTIIITDQQYIVPKDGSPIRGLIQDHIVSGVLLTCRDTFLTRDAFQQLLYASCWNTNPRHPIVTPIPAILKPQPLWSLIYNFSLFLSRANFASCRIAYSCCSLTLTSFSLSFYVHVCCIIDLGPESNWYLPFSINSQSEENR